ncbi:ABC-F family ATP-binding cassette domain-containing protein [Bacillota bacterium]
MVIVSASEICKSFGAEIILNGVSFHVNEGDRIGIIGDNGTGKTTLLSIISGFLSYDSGNLYMSAKTDFGCLRQNGNFSSEKTVYDEMLSVFSHVRSLEDRIHKLSGQISRDSAEEKDVSDLLSEYDILTKELEDNRGFSYQSEIRGILSSMAFPEDYYDKKISTLSGGERTRLALASLLLQRPKLLLLDEPTNHLDIGTLKWLEQFLESYSGTLMVVSHDRYFLDRTVNRIFELNKAALSAYDGNYSAYLVKKKQKDEDALKQYERQVQEIQRQEEIIRRFKQHGTEKLARRARSREKQLEHFRLSDRPSVSGKHIKMQFKEKFQSGNDVLAVRDLSASFPTAGGRRILFSALDIDIKRGERVCILGPNGVGKTTLLNIITGRMLPDSGLVRPGQNVTIGYYDQQQALLNSELTVLEELHESYRLYTETELRSLLGRFCFHNDDVFKKVNTLSGGERVKLSLLKLMLSGSNFLIMDEPTNHLDISAKESFEDALLYFPGTVLIVSHDRYLLNKIPTRIIEMSPDGVENYPGTYDYYMEKKQSISSARNYLGELGRLTSGVKNENDSDNPRSSAKEAKAEARRKAKEDEAKRRKLERELAEAESSIEKLELEIRNLEGRMCHEEVFSDHTLSAAYSVKLCQAKEDLEAAYADWAKLHEENIK